MNPSKRAPSGLLAVTIALSSMGCASSEFRPSSRGVRLAIILEDGQVKYVREGRTYSWLTDAVADHDAAVRAAKAANTAMVEGVGLEVVGLSLLIAGMFISGRNSSADARALSGGLALGGAGALFGATALISRSYALRLDAINLYNDGAYR